MTEKDSCFKAYDVRGRVPDELDDDLAYRIGRAYAVQLSPDRVAVGRDIRLTSPALAGALIAGLTDAGVQVLDLGLCGTEEVYFATFHLRLGGGIMVTASHNPADYNGMKFVGPESRPISNDSGLRDIAAMALAAEIPGNTHRGGQRQACDCRAAYIDHLLGSIDVTNLAPLKLVVNPGNGCAGPVIDLLEPYLPFTLVKILDAPDGRFPNGVPNPLLPENRETTARAVQLHGADMGIAWDGDFDRCFLFDEQGGFIEGYYLVGLLAQAILRHHPGGRIIHDPRLIWNTIDLVRAAGGVPVMCKTGHAFIKARMRLEDAVYGGEMSAHHYFRDFAYCDSGMLPWLLVAEIVGRIGTPLSSLVRRQQMAYPVSGEINRRVADPDAVIARIEAAYSNKNRQKDSTDGLSISTADYRFNVRKSNTEPVLRLNVETRGDQQLLADKTSELLDLIKGN